MSLFNSPFALRLGLALTTFTTVCLLISTFRTAPPPPLPQGAVVHIVMFEYAPGVTAPTKAAVSAAFVALRETCRLPSGARYILAVDGGPNSSPEGQTHGMEHAFVVAFRSAAERDYYLDADPAHQAFKASVREKVAGAVVFDFASGEFARESVLRRRRRPSDEVHVRTV
ncbi:hypothetical protein PHLGIDRAFT_182708 [Phlebiopsis gigantea 11061_1 CR5-6]|uniref:Stress-response A/B barrel domain-containing protein n=1 Tax=Phlebiopsis gigantea (strain 11061_1 CR5-6) TaxID=745531 RepID=A0A0C3S7H0_PHLG1|nr:hypothetical protein PHLGIDRAFT_182708 [Phlebiopsis gigantea 11061_1 CR5-6]